MGWACTRCFCTMLCPPTPSAALVHAFPAIIQWLWVSLPQARNSPLELISDLWCFSMEHYHPRCATAAVSDSTTIVTSPHHCCIHYSGFQLYHYRCATSVVPSTMSPHHCCIHCSGFQLYHYRPMSPHHCCIHYSGFRLPLSLCYHCWGATSPHHCCIHYSGFRLHVVMLHYYWDLHIIIMLHMLLCYLPAD